MGYPKASESGGQINPIKNCSLYIPNEKDGMDIQFQALPTVTDGKGAKYDPTPVIGRANPLVTFANSDLRTISLDCPFFVTSTKGNSDSIGTVAYNLKALRAISSAVYPRKGGGGVTYRPPPVCVLTFGAFLATANTATLSPLSLCVIIDKYSVKNDPAVPSDPDTLCPYKFTVNVSMIKVYTSQDLPNQDRIWRQGA